MTQNIDSPYYIQGTSTTIPAPNVTIYDTPLYEVPGNTKMTGTITTETSTLPGLKPTWEQLINKHVGALEGTLFQQGLTLWRDRKMDSTGEWELVPSSKERPCVEPIDEYKYKAIPGGYVIGVERKNGTTFYAHCIGSSTIFISLIAEDGTPEVISSGFSRLSIQGLDFGDTKVWLTAAVYTHECRKQLEENLIYTYQPSYTETNKNFEFKSYTKGSVPVIDYLDIGGPNDYLSKIR